MDELQAQKVKTSQVTQQLLDAPLRESIGYTVKGRKKLQELRKEANDIYTTNLDSIAL
jgi:hypothetical protein